MTRKQKRKTTLEQKLRSKCLKDWQEEWKNETTDSLESEEMKEKKREKVGRYE